MEEALEALSINTITSKTLGVVACIGAASF